MGRSMQDKKYIILLADGMADEPIPQLQGKTPLEYANTPLMDELAPMSEIGRVRTIPEGMNPGSDVANMTLLGYDPATYYRGRASLEASRLGISWPAGATAIRLNFITLEGEGDFEQKRMLSFNAGGLGDNDARLLLDDLQGHFPDTPFSFHFGTGFHHILMGDGQHTNATPPHDIIGQPIGGHMGDNELLRGMMRSAHEYLRRHPVNAGRAANGKPMANGVWLWGSGTETALPDFCESNGLPGAVVTATDVVGGIARSGGMELFKVGGFGGATDYQQAATLALHALLQQGCGCVYIHIETPDNAGHDGDLAAKISAIENIDRHVLGPVKRGLDTQGIAYRLLLLPDHPTPIRLRTHTRNPVPYMLYDSTRTDTLLPGATYSEAYAKGCEPYFDQGYKLFRYLLNS